MPMLLARANIGGVNVGSGSPLAVDSLMQNSVDDVVVHAAETVNRGERGVGEKAEDVQVVPGT